MILDWVPAHFPRDDFALARFDGTALYEHADPRRGAHPDWGTLVFNYGRNEVRNFLVANALYWLRRVPRRRHARGRRRVDALPRLLARGTASGCRTSTAATRTSTRSRSSRSSTRSLHAREPGRSSAAEESTAWPGVSRPTYLGGLGFGFKWNMGWMHDTLAYFQQDPVYRRWHHHELTFSSCTRSPRTSSCRCRTTRSCTARARCYTKMPGDRWQKLANLRALYAYMWAHPGKKLLFMGRSSPRSRSGATSARSTGTCSSSPQHARHAVARARPQPRLPRAAGAVGARLRRRGASTWLEPNDADNNVVAFARTSRDSDATSWSSSRNLSPVPRENYRLGLPRAGPLARGRQHRLELLRRLRRRQPRRRRRRAPSPWDGQPFSAEVTLPPLGAVWLVPDDS